MTNEKTETPEVKKVESKWRRCEKCGLRIRGKNHDQGNSHINRTAKKR